MITGDTSDDYIPTPDDENSDDFEEEKVTDENGSVWSIYKPKAPQPYWIRDLLESSPKEKELVLIHLNKLYEDTVTTN